MPTFETDRVVLIQDKRLYQETDPKEALFPMVLAKEMLVFASSILLLKDSDPNKDLSG